MPPTGKPTPLVIRVTPRAVPAVVGPWADGVLAVRVAAAPAAGAANEAACRAVAEALGLAPSAVRLASGARSRTKRLHVVGFTPAQLEERLRRLGPPLD